MSDSTGTPPPGDEPAGGWAQPPGGWPAAGYGEGQRPVYPTPYGPPPGGGYPPGGPPPSGPSPRPRRGKAVAILGVVGAIALVIAGGAIRSSLVWWSHRHGSTASSRSEPTSIRTGGCVRITQKPTVIASNPQRGAIKSAPEYGPVRCGESSAYAKVTRMHVATGSSGPGGSTAGASAVDTKCPADTDEIAGEQNTLGREGGGICLRNLKAPHPGDVGHGGGLVRTGDCLQVYDTYSNNLTEVPCSSRQWRVHGVTLGKIWFGKIVGRAAAVHQCPAHSLYEIKVNAARRPVFCVAKRGGWLPSTGDCVDSTHFFSQGRDAIPVRRTCSGRDRLLAAKITAVVARGHPCPHGSHPAALGGYIPKVCARYSAQ